MAAKPANYFEKSKKGEVNELQQLLRNLKVQRDPVRKREVVKKVRRTRRSWAARDRGRATIAAPPLRSTISRALAHLPHPPTSPPPPPARACWKSCQITIVARSLPI